MDTNFQKRNTYEKMKSLECRSSLIKPSTNIRFQTKQRKIVCDSDEATKDNFYNRLESLYDLVHNDGQMLHGDFKA